MKTIIKKQFNKLAQFIYNPTTLKAASYSAVALGVIAFLSGKAQAISIEDSINAVGGLSRGPAAKLGLTVATLFGTGLAASKASIGVAVAVFLVGVGLSYYIGWIWSPGFAPVN